MILKEEISQGKIPNHVAIIMDGNGRWAKQKGKDRIFGHKNGVAAVREVTESAAKIGIKYLTLYAFSTENWNRPVKEVNALMSLLVSTISAETNTLMKNKVSLLTIGDTSRLPVRVYKKLEDTINKTSENDGLSLVLALSYSSRWEILNAVKNIASEVKRGKIKLDQLNEKIFSNYLCTKNIPDPELLIRTSGEQRISNFLLWQIAYSELYFTDKLWPDFKKEDLYAAILDFQSRERRFGKISEQVNF
ncbi:MAG: isoprenyl transferase [Bacteroidales bacterium]|nr:isoprenyl transferase [Bacteroidales bacterium]